MNRSITLTLVFLFACNSAKDKELAELRAKVAKLEPAKQTPPSMAAATKAEPSLTPNTSIEIPQEKAHAPSPLAKRIIEANDDPKAFGELLAEAASVNGGKGLSYSLLKKNPERWSGTAFKFTGRVLQITELENASQSRISLGWDAGHAIFVTSRGTNNYVEGDWVDVLGILTGSFSYESQAGWKLAIPQMIATNLMKQGSLNKVLKVAGGKKAAADSDDE